jgi:hypothetical protein
MPDVVAIQALVYVTMHPLLVLMVPMVEPEYRPARNPRIKIRQDRNNQVVYRTKQSADESSRIESTGNGRFYDQTTKARPAIKFVPLITLVEISRLKKSHSGHVAESLARLLSGDVNLLSDDRKMTRTVRNLRSTCTYALA